MKGVKELIHIKDSGWFYDDTVVTAHSHSDQLRLKSPSVTVRITTAGNHLQLTVVTHQILKQHHIHIHCPEIIFQDPDVHTFFQKIGGIFFYKCCLSGSEKPGYQIDLYHISSFTYVPSIFQQSPARQMPDCYQYIIFFPQRKEAVLKNSLRTASFRLFYFFINMYEDYFVNRSTRS